ncbi:TolB family protein [Gillisia marina]|uniref:TolB family protein n=1 Tax=Gillisia marina TaxID=1167637 RepID=UPI0005280142|nr:PD40 domain-containing protein [Gillisia marina]
MLYKVLSVTFCIIITFNVSGQSKKQVEPAFTNLFSEFQNVRDFSMNSDGTEVYFTAQSILEEISIIVQAIKTEDSWIKKQLITSSGKFKDLEPFLAPDGLKLYFASNRPTKDSSEVKKDFDIWYLERKNKNDNWSDPININTPINSEFNEFYPSVSENGNLYFTSDRPNSKGKDDIYLSEWNSGAYQTPVSLSDSINSDGYEFNAIISPKEDFLIFSGYNREDGVGSGDLYISNKLKNGDWERSRNLGASINSDKMDYCPFIDFETNTLYFTSKRSAIQPRDFNSLDEFKKALNNLENGQSKIYKTSFKPN